ncbi:MAG: hypothetical protein HZB91_03805, partial [Elusimicrobia bacterium]|nr:hypothetical protein [Elusimicrobiota bacterium]
RMYTAPSEIIKELNFRCDRLFEAALAPAADQRPESAMSLYQRLKEL